MTFANDELGRRTSRSDASGTTTYSWDGLGHLATVTVGSAEGTRTSRYLYGASGMREAKVVADGTTTTTTRAVWSGNHPLIERDEVESAAGTSSATLRYLYGSGGIPLALEVCREGSGTATTRTYGYLTDAGGSVTALVDSSGTVAAAYSYDPWGAALSTGGTDAWLAARQPLRYRSYYADGDTGLSYLPARYYDPDSARFLSPDPAPPSAGDPASLNRYAYCGGDPVGLDDPSGADPPGKGVHDQKNVVLYSSFLNWMRKHSPAWATFRRHNPWWQWGLSGRGPWRSHEPGIGDTIKKAAQAHRARDAAGLSRYAFSTRWNVRTGDCEPATIKSRIDAILPAPTEVHAWGAGAGVAVTVGSVAVAGALMGGSGGTLTPAALVVLEVGDVLNAGICGAVAFYDVYQVLNGRCSAARATVSVACAVVAGFSAVDTVPTGGLQARATVSAADALGGRLFGLFGYTATLAL